MKVCKDMVKRKKMKRKNGGLDPTPIICRDRVSTNSIISMNYKTIISH